MGNVKADKARQRKAWSNSYLLGTVVDYKVYDHTNHTAMFEQWERIKSRYYANTKKTVTIWEI